VKNSRMMIVYNLSSHWAVLGFVSLSTLMAVPVLIGQTVPLDVPNEVAPVTLFCRVYGTGLVRGAPYAIGQLVYALEGVIPVLEVFEPSWFILKPLEGGEPLLMGSPVRRVNSRRVRRQRYRW
jgi:hypothetical protein